MKQFIFIFLCLVSKEYTIGQGVTKNGKIVSAEASYVNRYGAVGITGVNKNGQLQVTLNSIGQNYQGGVIFYILQSGDVGYDASVIHGLIVSTADHPGGIPWYIDNVSINAGTNTALGSGLSNTNSIISALTALGAVQSSYAAGWARAYTGGGYSDWYLPSLNEMIKIFQNIGPDAAAPLTNIVNLSTEEYWTSSQFNATRSYSIHHSNFSDYSGNGWTGGMVRPIRSF